MQKVTKIVICGLFVISLGLCVGCGPSKGVEKGKDDTVKKIEGGGGQASPQEGGPKLNEKNALGGAGKKKN